MTMKKIAFSNQYGLTKAVLEGRKTMTRRLVPAGIMRMAQIEAKMFGESLSKRIWEHSPMLCERVAIAQSYFELYKILEARDFKRTDALYDEFYRAMQFAKVCDTDAGWNNKMYVRADLMPHHIHIQDVKVAQLQDISDEDCIKEGIIKYTCNLFVYQGVCYSFEGDKNKMGTFKTPREAFACLINKLSGKGTWEANPYVFVYSFILND